MTPAPADWTDDFAAGLDPDALEAAVLALTNDIPPVEPPTYIFDALLAAVADSDPCSFLVRRPSDAEFVPARTPGLSVKILHLDRKRKVVSLLMRVAPGATFPVHTHDGPEECVVLEGELEVGGITLRPGDYQRAEPGTVHSTQSTKTGALLYLSGPLSILRE